MEQHQSTDDVQMIDDQADIELDKPSKSRFLFLLGFFGFFIFCWAGCYNLGEHGYKSNKDVKVPESATYDPKYK